MTSPSLSRRFRAALRFAAGLDVDASSPIRAATADAVAREEISGLGVMLAARLAALLLIAIWVTATVPFERSGLYLAVLLAFAALGVPPWLISRRAGRAHPLAALFLVLDAALLSYLLIFPHSYAVEGWTPQLNLRLPSVLYMCVFIVSASLSYSPRLVLAAGLGTIVFWTAGALRVAALPGSAARTSVSILSEDPGPDEVVANFLSPEFVSLTSLQNQVMALSLVTLILTLAVWRSRRLLRRSVEAEAQRVVLTRYFPQELAREIAADPGALDRPTSGPAAVLFADMIGFTRRSERMRPGEVLALLAEFHARLARVAMDHGGAVDKYIGDAIMVHFGMPRGRRDDAVRALACAAAMTDAIDGWNRERTARGEAPIGLGIGLQYGEVVAGNIGDEQRLEFAVLGDTVNIASRLEGVTRDLDARLVVGEALIRAVRAAGENPTAIIPDLHEAPPHRVHGRSEPVAIWLAPSGSSTPR